MARAQDIKKRLAEFQCVMKELEPKLFALPLSVRDQNAVAKRASAEWRAMLGTSPQEITATLRARWKKLASEPLRKLAALLCKATPTEVAISGGDHWLRMVYTRAQKVAPGSGLSAADFPSEELELWLPEPREKAEIEAAFAAVKIKAPRSALEFFASFGELRNVEPPCQGNFALPARADVFPTSSDDLYDAATVARWKGAVVIYHAPNGDRVLLDGKGKTAWTQFETDEIAPIGSFEDFVAEFRAAAARFEGVDSW